MMNQRQSTRMRRHGQSGAVLVVGLILLAVMTMIGVISMRSSVLEHKSAINSATKAMAMESAEAPRPYAGAIMDEHVYERGWTGVSLPTGMSMVNLDASNNKEDLFLANESGEDLLASPSVLKRDFQYARDVDGNGTISANDDLVANLYAYRTGVIGLPGHSAAMLAGYEGTGKALAASGAAMMFAVHSQGEGPVNARAGTEADFKVIVRN